MMKRILSFWACFCLILSNASAHVIYDDDIKTLQVVVDDNWLDMPVMTLNSSEHINISFDQLSHTYHRYTYKIEHCEADWSISDQLMESDYLVGFNNNTIDDYQGSINTNVLYTHYAIQIPNDRCKLTMSGNYVLSVYDEDEDNKKVLEARFMIVEPVMNAGLSVSTNTDVDVNRSHQQVSMSLNYGGLTVTQPSEQIHTIVMQNGLNGESRSNVKPDYVKVDGMQWVHNRQLIFDGCNEYHKYEVLSVNHPTMGVEHITWDDNRYHIYPFVDEPRKNYVYDEDANGAFYIRNSDNEDNDITCDYVMVHYKLKLNSDDHEYLRTLLNGQISVNGNWTTSDHPSLYNMTYDQTDNSFNATILQKQGYYSYRYIAIDDQGKFQPESIEPSFYQTENEYQALIYYKQIGGRADRLVGYVSVNFHQ